MPTFDIDLSAIDTSTTGGWKAYPAGVYRMLIAQSEVKTTRAGTGTFLKVELIHTGGDFKDKKHWENLNLTNPNANAESMGREQLAILADACGLPRNFLQTVGNEALVGKVVMVDLARKLSDNPDYGDSDGYRNEVTRGGYAKPNSEAITPPPAQASAPSDSQLEAPPF